MLFAIVDYIKYVSKTGHYSTDTLTRLGAIHATPGKCAAVQASLSEGDNLFVHPTRSAIGWAIMYLTHGPWSHVGGIVGPGIVGEAVASGTGEYPLQSILTEGTICCSSALQ